MFEAVQFVEKHGEFEPTETLLGEYLSEQDAVAAARRGRQDFKVTESRDYAWWIVRRSGANLAEFIADSTSDKEFILDLTSGELVEIE